MIKCTDCGATQDTDGYWLAADPYCRHWHRKAEPPESLNNEIKLLLTTYSPGEILEAARRLAGGA